MQDGATFVVKGKDFEETFEKAKFLQSNCAVCRHRNPVIYDEMLGDPVEEQTDVNPYSDVEKIEAMDPEKKQGFFSEAYQSLHPVLRLQEQLPLVLLSHLFRGRIRAPVGGKKHRSHGYHDLSFPEGLSLCGTMYRLRCL